MKLLQKEECGKGMYHLTFDADSSLIVSFQKPGQFAVINGNYFALASRPQINPLEFLIKKTETSKSITDLTPGQELSIQKIGGEGFNLSHISANTDIHFFSMGSGIAPIRSLIDFLLHEKKAHKSMTLWQASFTEEYLPFRADYERWNKSGLRIETCLDQDTNKRSIMKAIHDSAMDFSNAVVYWIGSKEFGEETKKVAVAKGLADHLFLTNY